MAIRAFALPTEVTRNPLNTFRVDLVVQVVILGPSIGEFFQPTYELPVVVTDLTSAVTVEVAIQAAVRADLELHGVLFDLGDVVMVF